MATGVILGGLGLAVFGFAGRYAMRLAPQYAKAAQEVINNSIPSGALSKYYRGGFEPKMSRREAGLVLGVSPSVSKAKLKEAHKRIMLLNHPDKGGSPYLAAKINEAKDYLESNKQ